MPSGFLWSLTTDGFHQFHLGVTLPGQGTKPKTLAARPLTGLPSGGLLSRGSPAAAALLKPAFPPPQKSPTVCLGHTPLSRAMPDATAEMNSQHMNSQHFRVSSSGEWLLRVIFRMPCGWEAPSLWSHWRSVCKMEAIIYWSR